MSRKTVARSAPSAPLTGAAASSAQGGEIISILAAGSAPLPQRRTATQPSPRDRFVHALSALVSADLAIPELNFTKALEARSPATLRAMVCDLDCYARFVSGSPGAAIPARAERLVAWIDHLEARAQKPATIARKLATMGMVHALLDSPDPAKSPLVRDALRGIRRRQSRAQRQAAGLRLGEPIGDAPVKGFTLQALLEACDQDPPGLRDAALLSLGYDAGLRVSELLAVTVEALEVQEDGSGLLEIMRSKTDQEGQGAFVWVSPETIRRIAAWRDAAVIHAGPLFRRVAIRRTKARSARRALTISDLAYNAVVDPERMAAVPARQASVTFIVGERALTVAAVHAIIRKRALLAADLGVVGLMGGKLEKAMNALSTHSLRVGLTQDLFANGEDAGPIAQALRWSSVGTALRYGRKLAPASGAAARMLARRRT
jgi:site-specific recombinase XerD